MEDGTWPADIVLVEVCKLFEEFGILSDLFICSGDLIHNGLQFRWYERSSVFSEISFIVWQRTVENIGCHKISLYKYIILNKNIVLQKTFCMTE